MDLNTLHESLELLKPYYSKGLKSAFIEGYHDEIYLDATDIPLSQEDIAKMFDLGWDQNSSVYDEETDTYSGYDVDEPWHTFT